MKFVFAFAAIFHLLLVAPGNCRIYDPVEERADRFDHILWMDENGVVHNESLVGEPGFRPRSTGIDDITLMLYTVQNPVHRETLDPSENDPLSDSLFFDATRKNVFIVHGWNNDHSSKVNTLLRDAILARFDENVFVVDWGGPANWNYLSSKGAVVSIGDALGDFLNRFMGNYNLTSDDVVLIGHSLGSHVAGCAGSVMHRKPHYIIGLDPAGPLFTVADTSNRLDPTDAHFVQVVHTCGGRLSFYSAIGDTDYYPNGGKRQPGCGWDVMGTCAHSRSYEYLAESIRQGKFISHNCDSYDDYEEGLCYDNHESFLGSLHIDKEASGDYFLNTNDEEPFALD